MPKPINLIIADDHALFIDGMKLLLKDEPDIALVAVANDGRELLHLLQQEEADLVLLDINMPHMNGLDAARYIRQSHPSLRIVMLSTYNEEHLLEKAKALGAAGYLLKTANKEDLLQTIRLVAGGQTCFPYRKPEVKSAFDSNDSFLKQYSLTKREWEVLHLIKEGYTNPQIAQQLYLSQHTVDSHRKNIMQKLGVHSTAALFKFMANHT